MGESSKNLTKVDTNININTTVLPTTGTIVCANVSLLCRAFATVQSADTASHDTHPTPYLYSAAVQLATKITSRQMQEAVYGNSDQAMLLLFTVLTCLDTIATNIGKEAFNPDMIRQARQDSWSPTVSARFAAADRALTSCLNLLDLAATGGALLPQNALYLASDHKRRRDDDHFYTVAKQLKLAPQDTPSERRRRENNPHGHTDGSPSTTNPP